MISLYEAHALLSQAEPLEDEVLCLTQAHGRILAEDCYSPQSLPPFTSSAMDGYAFCHSAVDEFQCIGSIAAGDRFSDRDIAQGECYEIMTGAPLPLGCDTVIPVERCERSQMRVRVQSHVRQGANVRLQGEELARGSLLFARGRLLNATDLALLASSGVHEIRVRRKPRVVVFNTGSELVADLKKPLLSGQIYNSLAFYLSAMLQSFGCELLMAQTIDDDLTEAQRKVELALELKPDLMLTTGAVSMGRYDFIPHLLQQLNARVLYHKVAQRPGKPILAARAPSGCWIFGLPGNPVAAMVGFRFHTSVVLRRMLGLSEEIPLQIPLADAEQGREGVSCVKKARLELDQQGQAKVVILSQQSPAMQASLRESNGWALIEPCNRQMRTGQRVSFYPSLWSDAMGGGFATSID